MPKWSKLSEYVTLECDGVDFTPQLKKHKVHSVLFANIPSFGAGRHCNIWLKPWLLFMLQFIFFAQVQGHGTMEKVNSAWMMVELKSWV